jgi:hypothetical protein
MSDPFSQLTPKGGSLQGEVRQHTHNHSFEAWRTANILLPDIYLCDKNYVVPEPLAEDGKPMTPERRKTLMVGKTPMFTPSPDGDNSKAKPNLTSYVVMFDDDITPETLGTSAVNNRPKVIRVIPPKKLKDPNAHPQEDQKQVVPQDTQSSST